MYPVAILAGGLATRLRPITATIPKALVDVVGEPFIFHQLRYLRGQGIDRVVICIGYLGGMIQQAVGDGSDFGLEVVYSEDGKTLRGTGGALVKAIPLLGKRFFVLYGDSFLPIDFSPIQSHYVKTGKPALMTVLANQNKWEKSNVLYFNKELFEYNKKSPNTQMAHIDYGLGIVDSSIFEKWSGVESFDLADIYHTLSISGQLEGYEVYSRFYEIGSHQGLKETEDFFKRRRDELF
jgi:MurNAc alpha-1-phosphate uridylyltransferase